MQFIGRLEGILWSTFYSLPAWQAGIEVNRLVSVIYKKNKSL